MNISQVKDIVNRAKDTSEGIRNNNECKKFSSGRGNYCNLSSWPELSCACRFSNIEDRCMNTSAHTDSHLECGN